MPWKALSHIAAILVVTAASADDHAMTDNLVDASQSSWRFLTDGVMGGVSTGEATFIDAETGRILQMSGTVSVENNGGFIQVRTDLAEPIVDADGVRLVTRGNDQKYFVHIRTRGTVMPWQFYQAGFEVTGEWQEVRLPWEAFLASGRLLRSVPRPDSVTSVAVVAYGRPHEAFIEVQEIGFY